MKKISWKVLYSSGVSLVVVCAIVFGYNFGLLNFLMYNRNIDTNKETGNFLKYADTYGETLTDFLDFADTVVVGRVVSEPKYRSDSWVYYEAGDDVRSVDFPLSEFTIEVDEVLYGTAPKTISFVQMGEPGSDVYEKQVKTGDTVTLIATLSEEGYYCSVSCENGVFYHRGNRLYSYSNKPDLCKYDGVRENVLSSDVKRIAFVNRMKPETNFSKRTLTKLEEK